MRYIKQFDALRAIAVIMVILSHWIVTLPAVVRNRLGSFGVDMFFVLSGFLITSILLYRKDDPKPKVFTSFYLRRTLRIFPIYYLVILLLIGATNIETPYLYFLTYTSNYYFYNIGYFDTILSHFWSLAVEEQFYLVWPAVILYSPNTYLVYSIITFSVIGFISQYISGVNFIASVLTINCFHAFGGGALLAWIVIYKKEQLQTFFICITVTAIFCLCDLVRSIFYSIEDYRIIRIENTVLALLVITYIVVNQCKTTPLFKYFLNSKILIFLGKISYGIYVYHPFIPSVTKRLFTSRIFWPLQSTAVFKNNIVVTSIGNFIILLAVAWISYEYIEKPMLNLKTRFK
jgi:peptidoglycan/LPS O-acetylase OafA/YrhL